jgi:predicted porin
MKFKTSAIAIAVAGTVAAPMAAQADIYASARVGIESLDTGGVSDLDIHSFASRFGAKGETDLGNGMTGFGRYEWDVDFDNARSAEGVGVDTTGDGVVDDTTTLSTDASIKLRHRYVGVKGDFGSVTLGQTYHTFYNFLVGPVDSPWWGSGYNMVSYTGRTDNAITYAGGSGGFSFGATGYFVRDTDEEAPDAYEVAGSFGIGDMTLAVGVQHVEVIDNDVTGVTLSGIGAGPVTFAVAYQQNDDDDSLTLEALFGNAYVHIESASIDATDSDPISVTLGYTQSLGRNTTMWYEAVSADADSGDSDDDRTALRAVLKYDIM